MTATSGSGKLLARGVSSATALMLTLATALTGCERRCSSSTAGKDGRSVLSEARGGHGEYPTFQNAVWEVFRAPPETRSASESPGPNAPSSALFAIAIGLGNNLTQPSDRETLLSVVEWILYNPRAEIQRAELLVYLAQTDLDVLPPSCGRRLARLIAGLPPAAWEGVDPDVKSRLLDGGGRQGESRSDDTPPSAPP